jgi:hypothetical protein
VAAETRVNLVTLNSDFPGEATASGGPRLILMTPKEFSHEKLMTALPGPATIDLS